MHKHESYNFSRLSEGLGGGLLFEMASKTDSREGDYLKMLGNMQGVNLKQIGTPPGVFCVCFTAPSPSARHRLVLLLKGGEGQTMVVTPLLSDFGSSNRSSTSMMLSL